MKTKSFENVTGLVYDWIIPCDGNNHSIPYGTLLVSGIVNGETKKAYCKTYGDKYGDATPQYIIFEGQRFIVHNKGTMYSPKIELELWEKEKVNIRWMYII